MVSQHEHPLSLTLAPAPARDVHALMYACVQLTLVVYCLSLPSDRRDTSEEMRLTVLCPACEGEAGGEHSSTNSPHSGSYFTLKEKVYRQTDRQTDRQTSILQVTGSPHLRHAPPRHIMQTTPLVKQKRSLYQVHRKAVMCNEQCKAKSTDAECGVQYLTQQHAAHTRS